MSSLKLIIILLISTFLHCYCDKFKIQLYVISTITDAGTTGQSSLPAHIIALNEINSDADILPNFEFVLKLLRTNGDPVEALKQSVRVVTGDIQNNDSIDIVSPIILGAPWSSMSIRTAPVLGAYEQGQISSSATSIELTDRKSHPYFYRTIPSDALQGKALIELAVHYKWDKLGVIYVDDNYGRNLYKVIENEAKLQSPQIEVFGTDYYMENENSYRTVATFIRDNKLYITILIIKAKDCGGMLDEFNKTGVLGYPYFYLGTDNWYDESDIKKFNLLPKVQGFFGTIPSIPYLLTEEQYKEFNINNGNISIYNISKQIDDNFVKEWEEGNVETYGRSVPQVFARFGYDSMYTIAYALNKFDQIHNLEEYAYSFNQTMEEFTMKDLHPYIVNSTEFIGATGMVHFDANGDRLSGFYAFGFVQSDGSIKTFGGIDAEGNIGFDDNVVFPYYFNENGKEQPLSAPEIVDRKETVDDAYFYGFNIVLLICIIIVLCCMVLIACLKKRSGTKKGYNVQYFACIGCILSYIGVFVYGLQNWFYDYYDNYPLIYDIFGCNGSVAIIVTVFTLTILSSGAKAFAFGYSINSILQRKAPKLKKETEQLTDSDLRKYILKALIIDGLLLISFGIIQILCICVANINILSYQFTTSGPPVQQEDPLVQIQHQFPECTSELYEVTIGIYCLFLIFKCAEIWFILSVHEIKTVVTAIFIFLMFVSWVALNTKNHERMNYFYVITSILVIVIMNIILFFNVWPVIIELKHQIIPNTNDSKKRSRMFKMKTQNKESSSQLSKTDDETQEKLIPPHSGNKDGHSNPNNKHQTPTPTLATNTTNKLHENTTSTDNTINIIGKRTNSTSGTNHQSYYSQLTSDQQHIAVFRTNSILPLETSDASID